MLLRPRQLKRLSASDRQILIYIHVYTYLQYPQPHIHVKMSPIRLPKLPTLKLETIKVDIIHQLNDAQMRICQHSKCMIATYVPWRQLLKAARRGPPLFPDRQSETPTLLHRSQLYELQGGIIILYSHWSNARLIHAISYGTHQAKQLPAKVRQSSITRPLPE